MEISPDSIKSQSTTITIESTRPETKTKQQLTYDIDPFTYLPLFNFSLPALPHEENLIFEPKFFQKLLNYPCKYKNCLLNFHSKKELESHISSHKTFKCSYDNCNKSYCNKKNLDFHVESFHRKIMRYKCKFCGKKYVKSEAKNIHERMIHTNVKPYGCACGKFFVSKYYLNKHNRFNHNQIS